MKKLFLFCVLLLSVVGCARKSIESKELAYIEIGMDKEQVRQKLGRPSIVRNSSRADDGKLVEVHEYKVDRTSWWRRALGEDEVIEHYWLHFHDGKLVKWERGVDPQRQADKIVEMRVKRDGA
jgi:hypothetical protein